MWNRRESHHQTPTGIPQPDAKRARQLKSDGYNGSRIFQRLSSAARPVDVIDQNWVLSEISFLLEASRAGFLAPVGQELSQNSG